MSVCEMYRKHRDNSISNSTNAMAIFLKLFYRVERMYFFYISTPDLCIIKLLVGNIIWEHIFYLNRKLGV